MDDKQLRTIQLHERY